MQREGDRSEITGVTWKKAEKRSTDAREQLVKMRAGRGEIGHGEFTMRKSAITVFVIIAAMIGAAIPLLAQQQEPGGTAPEIAPPTYQPKFPGDPARSDSEAAALAYMRVVLRAQRQFNKQYGHFATSLAELVHSGSFTKRMVNPDRGDYTASFKGEKDKFVLTMTPKQLDAEHRSLYAEEDYKIHADDTKPADGDSPVVK